MSLKGNTTMRQEAKTERTSGIENKEGPALLGEGTTAHESEFLDVLSGPAPATLTEVRLLQEEKQAGAAAGATDDDSTEFGLQSLNGPCTNVHVQTLCSDNQGIASIPGTDYAWPSDNVHENGIDEYIGFFEHQVSAHCGLHAINNAVGFELLQAASMNIACTEYLAEMLREGTFEHPDMHIGPSGDYSEAVMAFALRHHTNTYELDLNSPVLQIELSKMCIFAPNVCGIIVNKQQRHWVTIKEVEGDLWLLDSQELPVKLTYEAYLEFLSIYGPAFPLLWIPE